MNDSGGTVGARDARSQFSELLARVQQGEEITITRHGLPVARLVPVVKPAERQGAGGAMRQLAARNRTNGLRIKDLVSEGRR